MRDLTNCPWGNVPPCKSGLKEHRDIHWKYKMFAIRKKEDIRLAASGDRKCTIG